MSQFSSTDSIVLHNWTSATGQYYDPTEPLKATDIDHISGLILDLKPSPHVSKKYCFSFSKIKVSKQIYE